MKNVLDEQYIDLLKDILENGVEKNTRNGKVLSVFGRSIRYKFKDGKFPLITTKKMAFKTMVTELIWFLRGETNIKYLVDNNCHIWDGDAWKNYQNKASKEDFLKDGVLRYDDFVNKIKTDTEFAKRWGNLGPVYGKQWRSWGRKNATIYDCKDVKGSDQYKAVEAIKNGEDVAKYGVKIEYQNNSIDQIQTLINDLKTNPDSRRLMVNSWNVGELDQMILPPCHYGFQVYTRELLFDERWDLFSDKPYDGNARGKVNTLDYLDDKNIPTRAISLMFNMRSSDVPLGLPFNIASYGLLLEIIAKEVNMVPDELIGNLGDCHIYLNQIDGVKEQIGREPFELPRLNIQSEIGIYDFFEYLNVAEPSHFVIENYQSHPHIKIPLSN